MIERLRGQAKEEEAREAMATSDPRRKPRTFPQTTSVAKAWFDSVHCTANGMTVYSLLLYASCYFAWLHNDRIC